MNTHTKTQTTQITDCYYTRLPNLPERISAGGIVCRIDPETQELLVAVVQERGKDQRAVLPKGGVEAGETVEQAAFREIGEEAGIHQLELLEKLSVNQRMGFRKTNWVTIHFFLFMTNQVDFRPTDVEHDYSPQWRPLDNIGDLFWPDQKNLVENNRAFIKQTCAAYVSQKEAHFELK